MSDAPCKGCTRPQKQIGCHGKCRDYLDFVDANEERKQKIQKEKNRLYARQGYMSDKQFRNAGKRVNKVFRQHMK